MSDAEELSCTAKLARVVLRNQGPLSPCEVATEACISESEASAALRELEASNFAEPVCGMCSTREQVYEAIE